MSDPTGMTPEQMRAEIQRLQQQLQAAEARAGTPAPGPSVGAVTVTGGDVVGGDKYVLIQSLTLQGEDPDHVRSAMRAYIDGMLASLDDLPLAALEIKQDRARSQPLRLSDVYVDLNTTFRRTKGRTLADALDELRRPTDRKKAGSKAVAGQEAGFLEFQRVFHDAAPRKPVSALEALAHHPRLTLLGVPGSGKTSFGAHVLLGLARAWRDNGDAAAHLGGAWTAGALLPIRVVLRRFAERHARDDDLDAGHLWRFIAEQVPAASAFGDAARALRVLQHVARSQGALVLFDGLDECGGEAPRQRVQRAIDDFAGTNGERLRCLVTARPYAFPAPDEAQGRYLLADFDDRQVQRFIGGWYQAVAQRGWQLRDEPQRLTAELQQAYRRPDLRKLTGNPLLLTLTATLHSEGRLPDDRADLYARTVDLLLAKWNVQIDAQKGLPAELAVAGLTQVSQLKPVLQRLAFEVHRENLNQAEQDPRAGTQAQGCAEIGEDRLVRALTPLVGGSRDKAAQAVEYIEQRAGLLIGLGQPDGAPSSAGAAPERRFVFPHRTFQEFLAACHLAAQPDSELLTLSQELARQSASHWAVVLPLAARLAGPARGVALADALMDSRTVARALSFGAVAADDWSGATLAAQALAEIGLVNLRDSPNWCRTLDQARDWMLAAMGDPGRQAGATAALRQAAGDQLAALGDPRFDPDRWHLPGDPMLGFVHIEADAEFRIGTRKADRRKVGAASGHEPDDDEYNSTRTPTQVFYIARFPVTVAQFRAWLKATGTAPGDEDALADAANRPVRWVSWFEARDYCLWLQQALLAAPPDQTGEIGALLRQGWEVRLPTELQWEKAARGGLARSVFSWGDEPDAECASQADTGLASTSAVGCFPANGFGLHDMLGNVWEWTASLQQAVDADEPAGYPQCTTDPRFDGWRTDTDKPRLVRGGAFSDFRGGVRCACRFHFRPVDRVDILGFRVVLSAAPVLQR